MLFVFIICLFAFLDQLIKYLITVNIPYGDTIEVIEGFFYLTHHKNPGASFSFLADQSWGIYVLSAFSIILFIAMIYFLYAYQKKASFLLLFIVSVLAAGNLGNLIDRVRLKGVIDYLMFDFGIFVFPVFNLADSCVVVAAIGLLLLVLLDKPLFPSDKVNKDKGADEHEESEDANIDDKHEESQ